MIDGSTGRKTLWAARKYLPELSSYEVHPYGDMNYLTNSDVHSHVVHYRELQPSFLDSDAPIELANMCRERHLVEAARLRC